MKLTYKTQYTILISTILLALIGIVMIYSSSSYSARINYNDAYFFVKKQAIAFGAGIVVMIFGCVLNLEILKKLKWIIFIISIVLLAIVFIPGVGSESYGATRWINLGFVTFQPSEIAKFGLMIFLAGYMAENPPTIFKKMIIPLLAGGSVCLLIILEPNMSITMCVGMALIMVLYIGGSPKKLFILMVVFVLVAVPLLIIIEPYRIKRILAFINPWENPKSEGYQLIQSYYALGSGGLFGVGLFRSRQKYLFLPFAENDFIFSVIGEELGLVGCIFVIAIFALLIFSGIRIAMKAKNKYHTMLATGLTAIIALQTIINIAVVSGSIPPTGVPLPYISAGGSSLMVFMFVSGLLYNIASVTNRDLSP
ncbi:MAG: putative lipid II flippase FtsW [Clostridiales bacterium]|nr:putative lipid II flippase FtsW [Clostridiales bacterium]